MIARPDVDLRALAAWNAANARAHDEAAAHPFVSDRPARYHATCAHCAAAKPQGES